MVMEKLNPMRDTKVVDFTTAIWEIIRCTLLLSLPSFPIYYIDTASLQARISFGRLVWHMVTLVSGT